MGDSLVIAVSQEIKDSLLARFTYENAVEQSRTCSIIKSCELCHRYGQGERCSPECPLQKYEEDSILGCFVYLKRHAQYDICNATALLSMTEISWNKCFNEKAKAELDRIKALIQTWEVAV